MMKDKIPATVINIKSLQKNIKKAKVNEAKQNKATAIKAVSKPVVVISDDENEENESEEELPPTYKRKAGVGAVQCKKRISATMPTVQSASNIAPSCSPVTPVVDIKNNDAARILVLETQLTQLQTLLSTQQSHQVQQPPVVSAFLPPPVSVSTQLQTPNAPLAGATVSNNNNIQSMASSWFMLQQVQLAASQDQERAQFYARSMLQQNHYLFGTMFNRLGAE